MRQFSTIANMKTQHITEDQIVMVVLNGVDQGAITYRISTSEAYGGTPNEITDHTLANGNVAVLQHSSGISSGTSMLFIQASAPVGWTRSGAHNNKALRIVSGAGGGSGGSVAFTTAFKSHTIAGTISSTTPSTTTMAAHRHTGRRPTSSYKYVSNANNGGNMNILGGYQPSDGGVHIWPSTEANNGSSVAHTHTLTGSALNLNVQYVDSIICIKD